MRDFFVRLGLLIAGLVLLFLLLRVATPAPPLQDHTTEYRYTMAFENGEKFWTNVPSGFAWQDFGTCMYDGIDQHGNHFSRVCRKPELMVLVTDRFDQ